MKKTMMLIVATALLGFGTAAADIMPMGRMPNCRMAGMQQQVALSDSQHVQIEKIQRKQWTLASAEHTALIKLNGELRIESLKARPDKQKIEQLAEEIGRHHATLARLKSSHLAETFSILTPEQRKNNEEMLYCPPMGGGGAGMRGGCGAQMQRGCGMM